MGGGTATPTAFIPDEAESLLQQLSETHAEWAQGAAKYGPGGTFDALRKRYISVQAMQLRDKYKTANEKVTEGRLEEEAHADEGYGEWLDDSTIKRAEWLTLDSQRGEWNTRLRFLTYSNTFAR